MNLLIGQAEVEFGWWTKEQDKLPGFYFKVNVPLGQFKLQIDLTYFSGSKDPLYLSANVKEVKDDPPTRLTE